MKKKVLQKTRKEDSKLKTAKNSMITQKRTIVITKMNPEVSIITPK